MGEVSPRKHHSRKSGHGLRYRDQRWCFFGSVIRCSETSLGGRTGRFAGRLSDMSNSVGGLTTDTAALENGHTGPVLPEAGALGGTEIVDGVGEKISGRRRRQGYGTSFGRNGTTCACSRPERMH